jgi:lipoprotein-anchoring transpeptidase ErfK/SrfK
VTSLARSTATRASQYARTRWRGRAGVVVLAVSALLAPALASASPATASGRVAPAAVAIHRWTIIATLLRDAPRYATSTSTSRVGTLPATWHGAASSLPVLTLTNKRVEVRVAQRPNGQVAWIPSKDAKLTQSPYEIVIHLNSTRLQLFKDGHGVLSAPVGVGTKQYPTPTGSFFAAFFASPPSSGYGPFVLVTSGHSNTITNWNYSGDAMVAIHGPLGADAAIGKHGARISHGCIRLHLADLAKLRTVPVGSPIFIVD